MKLAWICYNGNDVTILFSEPEHWRFDRIIPIVYAEIIKQGAI